MDTLGACWWTWAIRVGEAKQPGPQEGRHPLVLMVANVTSLGAHLEALSALPVDVIMLQEHAVASDRGEGMRAWAAALGWKLLLGPVDPEASKAAGGVGIMARRHVHLVEASIVKGHEHQEDLQQLWASGRAGVYFVGLPGAALLAVGVAYGWTGDKACGAQRERTLELLFRLQVVMDGLPASHKLMAGDINLTASEHGLESHFIDGGWYDMDEHRRTTSLGTRAQERTRLLHAFGNVDLRACLSDFAVLPDVGLPVHSPLRLRFDLDFQPVVRRQWLKPRGLERLFDDWVRFYCDHVRPHLATRAKTREAAVAAVRVTLHGIMDHMFASDAAAGFHSAVSSGDVDAAWLAWTRLVENSFLALQGVLGMPAAHDYRTFARVGRQHVGRGGLRTRLSPDVVPRLVRGEVIMREPADIGALRRQLHRVQQLVGSMRAMLPQVASVTASGVEWWSPAMCLIWSRFYKGLQGHVQDVHFQKVWGHVVRIHGGTLAPAAQLCAARLLERDLTLLLEQRRQEARAAKHAMHGHHHRRSPLPRAYEKLSGPSPQPLRCLRDAQTAVVTADPTKVDHIARVAWGKVYAGQEEIPQADLTDAFVAAFGADIYVQDVPEQVPEITAEDIKRACMAASSTAGGLDCWTAAEWKLLSHGAYSGLAGLLNAIEASGRWPRELHCGRLAYLAKEESDGLDPLGFRVLTLLPVLYRRWANTRLWMLRHWARAWVEDACFAGIPGRGATDAWFSEALQLEALTLSGTAVCWRRGGPAQVLRHFASQPHLPAPGDGGVPGSPVKVVQDVLGKPPGLQHD